MHSMHKATMPCELRSAVVTKDAITFDLQLLQLVTTNANFKSNKQIIQMDQYTMNKIYLQYIHDIAMSNYKIIIQMIIYLIIIDAIQNLQNTYDQNWDHKIQTPVYK